MINRDALQGTFLNQARVQKTPVTIFLVNGVKLQGNITWFDNFCILLRRDKLSQLVYKHAISTIMPARPLSLYEKEDETGDMATDGDGAEAMTSDVSTEDHDDDDQKAA